MKKAMFLTVAAVFAASSAFAIPDTNYEEMKAIKKAQREEREKQKASGRPASESKWAKFWRNEGERSGLGSSGARTKSLFQSLNPGPFFKRQEEAYNARKTTAGK